MKITGINSGLSGPGTTGLIVEPPLTVEVFQQIQALAGHSPLFSTLRMRVASGCLVISGTLNEHLVSNLRELLNEAERKAEEIKQAALKQAQAQEAAKNNAIKAAAQMFGVPVM
jgi:hypothetical protein